MARFWKRLTVKHDFSRFLFTDHHIGGAIRHGPVLRGVTLVQSRRVDLQDIGGPEDQIEALVTGQTPGVVHQNDIVSDAAVAGAPHGDGVVENG